MEGIITIAERRSHQKVSKVLENTISSPIVITIKRDKPGKKLFRFQKLNVFSLKEQKQFSNKENRVVNGIISKVSKDEEKNCGFQPAIQNTHMSNQNPMGKTSQHCFLSDQY